MFFSLTCSSTYPASFNFLEASSNMVSQQPFAIQWTVDKLPLYTFQTVYYTVVSYSRVYSKMPFFGSCYIAHPKFSLAVWKPCFWEQRLGLLITNHVSSSSSTCIWPSSSVCAQLLLGPDHQNNVWPKVLFARWFITFFFLAYRLDIVSSAFFLSNETV